MIEDFSASPVGNELQCDICVVGSGPVGLSLALEFRNTDTRIIVLESGGDGYEPEVEALSEIESSGHRRAHPFAVRRRLLGGTSSVWSGRCVPFSALDLQHRVWIPESGWPVSEEDVAPYLQRAGRILKTGPAVYDDRLWSLLGRRPHAQPWDASCFETQVFQASAVTHPRTRHVPLPHDPRSEKLEALNHSGAPAAEDVAEAARRELTDSRNVRVLLHAHAVEILTDQPAQQVRGVRIQSLAGRQGTVRASHVVLAAGGIDNARLLLLSRRHAEQGLGNQFDQVGRYLQDHHYAVVASLEGAQAKRLRRRMGFHWYDHNGRRHVYTLGASLSAQRQREESLPRATLFTFEHYSRAAALTAAKRLGETIADAGARALPGDVGAVLLHPLDLLGGVMDRYAFRRPGLAPISRLDIGCNVEQIPDPASRVTLGTRLDAMGQPLAHIDWRVHPRELETYRRAGELFVAECRRLGLEVPRLSPWLLESGESARNQLHDMAHPMGATRMSNEPRDGVVDKHCAVHGIHGLHIAGSSVFRTGGTSNPTLMAVALAIRLADRIKAIRLSGPAIVGAAPRMESGADSRIRVGIIGAGSRVRGVYHPVFQALNESFHVVGFTSRSADSRHSLADATGWLAHGTLDELVANGRPQFLVVAVNNDANVAVLHQAIARGLPVLAETPLAWQERAGRGLVNTARARNIALGVAEQFPFMPMEQLKRKLIRLGAIGSVRAVVNDFATYDYHGIAQLRSYVGYERTARRIVAQRFAFGHTGVAEGRAAASAALGWDETWLRGNIDMSGGALMVHDYSAGYAMLPTRPPGELRVVADSGSLVGDRMIHVNRVSGVRTESHFEVYADGISVQHPDLGQIEWRRPPWARSLNDEQLAVGLHVEAFREVVQQDGVPLYSCTQALDDIEILRGLHYSASRGGSPVLLPINARYQQALSATTKLRQMANRLLRRP